MIRQVMKTTSVVLGAFLVFCSTCTEGNGMEPQNKVQRDAADHPDSLPPPMISVDGQSVAGFYQVVQFGQKRIGFAVIDVADQLRPASLPAVPQVDAAAVARLRAAAQDYLSRGNWRAMATPDRAGFDSGRDSLHWKNLNLSVTVSEEGNLWFSQTDTGTVLGVTPFASTLIQKRHCSFNMLHHNLVFNDIAGFDSETRLAFVAFDVVEGDSSRAGFEPFRCDPSALVHILRVDLPKRRSE
jgi:hypothetical protein